IDVGGLVPLPGQSGVLIGVGGRPVLLEVFADEKLLATAWQPILDAAAREAIGRRNRATPGYLAREFVGLIDQMTPTWSAAGGIGRSIVATAGPLELRGIGDGERLLHAS